MGGRSSGGVRLRQGEESLRSLQEAVRLCFVRGMSSELLSTVGTKYQAGFGCFLPLTSCCVTVETLSSSSLLFLVIYCVVLALIVESGYSSIIAPISPSRTTHGVQLVLKSLILWVYFYSYEPKHYNIVSNTVVNPWRSITNIGRFCL